jgi:hypothetical protein
VEPYELQHNRDDLIVLTWQVEPEVLDGPGWRNFRVDRIEGVRDTRRTFEPRIPITLHHGACRQFVFEDKPSPSPPTPGAAYYAHLMASMLDGKITKEELSQAKSLGVPLSEAKRRAVHARVLATVIGEVCADGQIDDAEVTYLRNVRKFLDLLGWSP